MDTVSGVIYLVVITLVLIMMMILLRIRFKEKQMLRDTETQQQDRVYTISEQVQPSAWSSREAYLTVGHITVEHQMNKSNYDDAPPSYEEAMRIATTTNGESSTVVTVSTMPKEPN
nr:unnamed protein product [Callosobruchus chinensis]